MLVPMRDGSSELIDCIQSRRLNAVLGEGRGTAVLASQSEIFAREGERRLTEWVVKSIELDEFAIVNWLYLFYLSFTCYLYMLNDRDEGAHECYTFAVDEYTVCILRMPYSTNWDEFSTLKRIHAALDFKHR